MFDRPDRVISELIGELAVRAGQRARRTVVVEELIPYAKQRLLPEQEIEQRRRLLRDFVEESYRNVATKKLIKALDAEREADSDGEG